MGMNAVVIGGLGVVGKATAEAFGIEDYISLNSSTIDYAVAAKRSYIFICLPTPTIAGKCFTGGIEDVIKKLIDQGLSKDSVIIIRSTVYPGFSQHLQSTFGINNIVSNPEFLSEDTATEDSLKPDLIVIGGDNQEAVSQVVALYKGRFKYPEPIVTDSTTAEFIKYSLNSFFALKVVFANELFDGAQKLKANYEVVKKVLESHKWGTKNHLTVYHKKGRGAGGRCLPKDLEAFTLLLGSTFFQATHIVNKRLLEESSKQ